MLHRWAPQVLIAATVTSSACLKPTHVTGGPRQVDLVVKPAEVSEQLHLLVDDVPKARERLDGVDEQAAAAAATMYVALGLCSVSSGVFGAAGANYGPQYDGSGLLGVGLGFLGACTVVGLIGAAAVPDAEDYGTVLTAYNDARPHTPYAAPRLGVNPKMPPRTWAAAAPGSEPLPPSAPALGAGERAAIDLSRLLREGSLSRRTVVRYAQALSPAEREEFARAWPRYADRGPRADRVLRDVLDTGLGGEPTTGGARGGAAVEASVPAVETATVSTAELR